jgi:hypothetical protein
MERFTLLATYDGTYNAPLVMDVSIWQTSTCLNPLLDFADIDRTTASISPRKAPRIAVESWSSL